MQILVGRLPFCRLAATIALASVLLPVVFVVMHGTQIKIPIDHFAPFCSAFAAFCLFQPVPVVFFVMPGTQEKILFADLTASFSAYAAFSLCRRIQPAPLRSLRVPFGAAVSAKKDDAIPCHYRYYFLIASAPGNRAPWLQIGSLLPEPGDIFIQYSLRPLQLLFRRQIFKWFVRGLIMLFIMFGAQIQITIKYLFGADFPLANIARPRPALLFLLIKICPCIVSVVLAMQDFAAEFAKLFAQTYNFYYPDTASAPVAFFSFPLHAIPSHDLKGAPVIKVLLDNKMLISVCQ